jgi:hypothetical protein
MNRNLPNSSRVTNITPASNTTRYSRITPERYIKENKEEVFNQLKESLILKYKIFASDEDIKSFIDEVVDGKYTEIFKFLQWQPSKKNVDDMFNSFIIGFSKDNAHFGCSEIADILHNVSITPEMEKDIMNNDATYLIQFMFSILSSHPAYAKRLNELDPVVKKLYNIQPISAVNHNGGRHSHHRRTYKKGRSHYQRGGGFKILNIVIGGLGVVFMAQGVIEPEKACPNPVSQIADYALSKFPGMGVAGDLLRYMRGKAATEYVPTVFTDPAAGLAIPISDISTELVRAAEKDFIDTQKTYHEVQLHSNTNLRLFNQQVVLLSKQNADMAMSNETAAAITMLRVFTEIDAEKEEIVSKIQNIGSALSNVTKQIDEEKAKWRLGKSSKHIQLEEEYKSHTAERDALLSRQSLLRMTPLVSHHALSASSTEFTNQTIGNFLTYDTLPLINSMEPLLKNANDACTVLVRVGNNDHNVTRSCNAAVIELERVIPMHTDLPRVLNVKTTSASSGPKSAQITDIMHHNMQRISEARKLLDNLKAFQLMQPSRFMNIPMHVSKAFPIPANKVVNDIMVLCQRIINTSDRHACINKFASMAVKDPDNYNSQYKNTLSAVMTWIGSSNSVKTIKGWLGYTKSINEQKKNAETDNLSDLFIYAVKTNVYGQLSATASTMVKSAKQHVNAARSNAVDANNVDLIESCAYAYIGQHPSFGIEEVGADGNKHVKPSQYVFNLCAHALDTSKKFGLTIPMNKMHTVVSQLSMCYQPAKDGITPIPSTDESCSRISEQAAGRLLQLRIIAAGMYSPFDRFLNASWNIIWGTLGIVSFMGLNNWLSRPGIIASFVDRASRRILGVDSNVCLEKGAEIEEVMRNNNLTHAEKMERVHQLHEQMRALGCRNIPPQGRAPNEHVPREILGNNRPSSRANVRPALSFLANPEASSSSSSSSSSAANMQLLAHQPSREVLRNNVASSSSSSSSSSAVNRASPLSIGWLSSEAAERAIEESAPRRLSTYIPPPVNLSHIAAARRHVPSEEQIRRYSALNEIGMSLGNAVSRQIEGARIPRRGTGGYTTRKYKSHHRSTRRHRR